MLFMVAVVAVVATAVAAGRNKQPYAQKKNNAQLRIKNIRIYCSNTINYST